VLQAEQGGGKKKKEEREKKGNFKSKLLHPPWVLQDEDIWQTMPVNAQSSAVSKGRKGSTKKKKKKGEKEGKKKKKKRLIWMTS